MIPLKLVLTAVATGIFVGVMIVLYVLVATL